MKKTLAIIIILFVLFSLGNTASAKSTQGQKMSQEHRSAVSEVVKELKNIAGKNGGIGQEVSQIAQEQNESGNRAADAIEAVENRSGLKTFFLGTDYKNLGDLRSEIVTSENHIDRLTKAKERTDDPAIKADLTAQINALNLELSKARTFIQQNESKFSLLGWFVKLFQ